MKTTAPQWCPDECGQCRDCIYAAAARTPRRREPPAVLADLAAHERAIVTSRTTTERGN